MADGSDTVLSKLNEQMKAAIASFKVNLSKVRTGRASSGIIENLQVDYYGSRTHLSHLGQISTPEPRLIMIQVYDTNAVTPIEKAIQSAGLGLNPSREGNTIRILFPQLTEDARKDLVKHLHKITEEMRVSVRNHRRDANEELKQMEKESELSKDDAKRALERVQKVTDATISEVDTLLKSKEAECLEV